MLLTIMFEEVNADDGKKPLTVGNSQAFQFLPLLCQISSYIGH